VRARLPSIVNTLIQFECGADTTVQFGGGLLFQFRLCEVDLDSQQAPVT
jgi:hypothetical protein